jgi:hypothetical protein
LAVRSSTISPASSLQAPTSVTPPTPAEPAGVQPTAVRSRVPPTVTAAPPTKELSAGDLVCGQCGEGNEPVRKFCRRCGNSLATAEVASTSGSRKKTKRSTKVLAAGERPEHRTFHFGAVARIGAIVVVAVVLIGGIAYGAVPQVRSDVNSTIQSVTGTVTRPTPVQAASLTASSAIPGHPAARAIDEYSNTYWAASLKANSQPTLTVSFAKSETVSVMLFISGYTSDEASVLLPKTLHLVFSNGTTQNVTLADNGTPQQISINGAQGITGMTIQITSVYGSASGHPVALGDVEFFGTQ